MKEIKNTQRKYLTGTPRTTTNRLLLREIKISDAEEIYSCWMQDREVSRYMWWKASSNIEETRSFVNFELEQIKNEKWYRWIIELKETGRIIGTCMIFFNEEDKEKHWDISYNLGREFWGNGYVTEAMKAVMNFGESILGIRECVTYYAKVNTNSAKVLHKLGFIDEKTIPYECNGGEIVTEGVLCRYRSGTSRATE